MNKYELTNNFIEVNETKLYRIKALRDFGDIKAGDLGGYLESEINLSQNDNCWVFGDARVYGNARVFGDAKIFENARVYENAWVFGDAQVSENARVSGDAKIFENARVYENARVFGNARVYGNAVVSECQYVRYTKVTTNLVNDLVSNIEAQTGLIVTNNEVYCYKHVRGDLSSLYDVNFKYTVGEYIEAEDPDLSNTSCSRGIHVSNGQYWNNNGGEKRIFCRVNLEDIITVQEGKIRCKKVFVIGVCDGKVY